MNTLDVPGIRAEKLLSMRRYITFKLDLSFLFVTFEATAQKELGLYDHWTLTASLCDDDDDDYVPQTLLWHIVRNFSVRKPYCYRKGLKKDGTAPLFVYSYGSYGFSSDPGFSPARLVLLTALLVRARKSPLRTVWTSVRLLTASRTEAASLCSESWTRERTVPVRPMRPARPARCR
jgi:hypothetical protein